jgi:hypothetical protein
MDYTKKLGLKKKTTLQNITRNDAVRLVSLLENEKAVLAGKLSSAEKIGTKTMANNAELREKFDISDTQRIGAEYTNEVYEAKIAELEKELALAVKERCPHDYELFRSQNTELILENTKKQEQIADLEAQLAAEKEISKAAMAARYSSEVVEKKDGVYNVGDEVVVVRSMHEQYNGLRGTIYKITANQNAVFKDQEGFTRIFELHKLAHAAPSTPTCPECAAEQKRVDELEKANKRLSMGPWIEKQIGKLEKKISDADKVIVHLNDYKTGATAEIESLQERIEKNKTTIDSQSALIGDMDTALTRKNYTILQLSDQVAALEMGD